MAQIQGSGAGNYANTAMVNNSGGLHVSSFTTAGNELFTSGTAGFVKVTDGTNTAAVNASGQLHVVLMGAVDAPNSSTATLGSAGVFTGTAVDTLDYGFIFVNVFSDQASATDGLSVEQSSDGTNWDNTDVYTVPASTGKTYSFQPAGRYFRVQYTNGGVAQTAFRLQTVLKKTSSLASSHRIQDSISTDDDAELVKAVITGIDMDGTFQNVTTTTDGNLTISDNSNGLSIAEGNVTGKSFIHKFGEAPDFDTGDGAVTVWDGANDGGIDQMRYQYSSSADIDSISSSITADAQTLEIQGLDADYNLVTQEVTLNGRNRVALGSPLMRAFRMINQNSVDISGNAYLYVSGTTTNGVPDDSTNVRAVINNGNNQTLMAVYTIPGSQTGYMRDWYAATAGANKSSNYIMELYARPSGGVFQLKHRSSIADNGTSHVQHKYEEPEVFAAQTDIEMRATMTAAGGTEAAVVAGFDVVLVDD